MDDILLSALRANEAVAANASSNIANMNTPSYRALKTTIVSSSPEALDVVTLTSDERGPLDEEGNEMSNVDPAREIVVLMQAKNAFEMALKAISTREEMLNDLVESLAER
ncbi:MAG TPA: flagellar basal body rod C-terminal domain-containing protein [Deltaproteobacteria bacterium]|nr:flagellar basal body rod C-terminal domain-containing protein [Deltaproteobacteria bacterium]HOM27952.1 flagellar basal body rod C-terminal domain-containing protein [Deltaproteobacteria bacterium]HPP80788.1 flagellar basal body rod C-terminal domain-containing protein [Deltaproteobacteria bacterium]